MMTILRGGHISAAIRLWTRHATRQPFTHFSLEGASGRGILQAIDPAASGLFIFGHPTLGDWSTIPALAKSPEGGVLHEFAGTLVNGMPPDPMDAETFAQLHYIEMFVRGHIRRYVNGQGRAGVSFVGMQLDDTTLLDSLDARFVEWRSDVTPWRDAPDEFKDSQGNPRVRTEDVIDTPEIIPAT